MSDVSTTPGRYIFEAEFEEEKARLDAIGWLFDPGSIERLAALDIQPDWHCLEVGAGSGTVAAWLADRVDGGGSVLATDIDLDHLQHLEQPNVEVRHHDITRDTLPDGAFDLIHSRMVLQHLGPREVVLERLIRALKPGGILMVEDSDWSSLFRSWSDARELRLLRDALGTLMAEAGFLDNWGLGNVEALRRLPVTDLRSEGRVRVVQGGTPGAHWYTMTFGRVREPALARGLLTADEFERGLAMLEEPDRRWLTQVMIATWARRPLRSADPVGASR